MRWSKTSSAYTNLSWDLVVRLATLFVPMLARNDFDCMSPNLNIQSMTKHIEIISEPTK